MSIDLSQNPNLQTFEGFDNMFASLDFSNNLALLRVRANQNQLTGLDVSLNTAVIEVRVNDNALASLNVQNGNNTNFTAFNALNNPSLTCVFVDDAAYSTATWTQVDATSTFVNDQAGCDALGVNDFALPALTLHPNPASTTVQIEGLITTATYTLYNAIGLQVSRGQVANNEQIDINSLASGLYFLKFDSGNILKFIKE
jgi:hypothetical protein